MTFYVFSIVASPVRPECQQMYNLFHASDPTALRIEPLVNYMFKQIPPIKIARYNRFPMGDGESLHLGKVKMKNCCRFPSHCKFINPTDQNSSQK